MNNYIVEKFALILLVGAIAGGCRAVVRETLETEVNLASNDAPVFADSNGPPPMAEPMLTELDTLPEYLAYAALHNAGLEAAFNRWRASLERVPQVKALPDPKFTYGYYVREVETRTGPQNQRFGFGQTFPWFGKLSLRGDKAAEAANAAHASFQAEKLRVFYEVKKVFFEYYFLRQAISITEDNIDLLKSLERVAQAKVRAGSDTSGVLKAQVEIGKLEDQIKTLRELRQPLVTQLNAALNIPTTTMLPWPNEVMSEDIVLSAPLLLEKITHGNPELRALAHKAKEEELGIDLARKEFYPDFTLGVDYIETGSSINPGLTDSGKDPIIAMFSINVPLWQGKYRAGLKEASNRRDAALNTLENRENNILSQLQLALYQFEDSERKIGLYRDTLLPLATNSLGVAQESYESGGADFLELIDAQRLLLEFQLAYERAFTNRQKAFAEIEMLIGSEINQSSIQKKENIQ